MESVKYIYCIPCRQTLHLGQSSCSTCGGTRLACLLCHADIPAGSSACPRCSTDVVLVSPERVAGRNAAREALATIPAAVAHVARVPEVYQAGRHGVKAEVQIPPIDAAIMNELLQICQLLHGMAGRLNQFQGMTEHTRKLIRDMRILACDAQEEVELRRGPA